MTTLQQTKRLDDRPRLELDRQLRKKTLFFFQKASSDISLILFCSQERLRQIENSGSPAKKTTRFLRIASDAMGLFDYLVDQME